MIPRFLRTLLLFVATALGLLSLGGVAWADSAHAAPSTTTTSAASTARSHHAPAGDWGKRLQGQPTSFQAGGTDGYYFWHDADGLHLRTTDSSGVYTYSGRIVTTGTLVNITPVKLDPADHFSLLNGGKVLEFSFVTHEGIDGINFRVVGGVGTTVHLHLDRNETTLDPSNIFLGEDGVHPEHNPMTIERREPVTITVTGNTIPLSSASTTTSSTSTATTASGS